MFQGETYDSSWFSSSGAPGSLENKNAEKHARKTQ